MSKILSDKKRVIKILKKILPLIGVIILFYIIHQVGPEKIMSSLLKISPIVFVLIGVFLLIKIFLHNYAWQMILKKQKINLSFFKSLKIQLIGQFYAFITPGSVGQYSRVIYLKEETNEPFGKLFVNVFIKTTVTSFSFYLILLIGIFFIIEQYPIFFVSIFMAFTIIKLAT